MIRILIVVMVLATVQLGFCENQPQDPYEEQLVASFVNPQSTYIIYAMQEKALNRLGDRAAIGLIRYLGARNPSTSKEVERILGVIKIAYAAPEAIGSDADREPKATLLLLAYLSSSGVSKQIRPEFQQTRIYILHQVEEYKQKHPQR